MCRINIIHILHSFKTGGVQSNITNLVDRMDRKKYSHSICVFDERVDAFKNIKNKECKISIIKRFYPNDPSVILRLVVLLRREMPAIVCTYNWGGIEGILAARLSGVPIVLHSENGLSDIVEIKKPKMRRMLARKFLLGMSDKVIAVSKSVERWLIKDIGIDRNKVAYIPNGCDVNKFTPGKDAEGRNRLGIAASDIVIGTVGLLTPLKDHETLIKAFALLAVKRGDLKLLIVGDGPLRGYLEKLAEAVNLKEKIIFAGMAEDASQFYKIMDIFVVSSVSEGFSNTLIEAMSSGLPTVATKVGDIEYILGDSRGGVLVIPGDAAGLADGIKFIMDDQPLAGEMSRFVRERAQKEFNLDDMAKAYESLCSTGAYKT